MKIGDVSKSLGMPASTIRYYEREGLIGPVSRNAGVREFNDHSLFTLRFVQLAQAAGFSINEMKSLLEQYQQNPNPTALWPAVAKAKREAVATKISELQAMHAVLGKLIDCECESLARCVEIAMRERAVSDQT